MDYDAIIVGGGIAGLTAAAYLAKAGHAPLLCERQPTCGGLVNTFERDGFFYDGGIRAMEDSGVLFPMLRHLGLEVEFVENHVSMGIEDRMIRIKSADDIAAYQSLLSDTYPESEEEIAAIVAQVRKIMHYMDIQYGIDNPLFLGPVKDWRYMVTAILPWMVKYALTVRKIGALNEPVEDFLRRYTQNQSLLDIIAQHFFRQTPAFFALSYLTLYLDYHYPRGGTGRLVEEMVRFIEKHGGTIGTGTEIVAVDPDGHAVVDAGGKRHGYRRLVWAADLKALYNAIDPARIGAPATRDAVADRRRLLADKAGNDSVLTLVLALDLDRDYFASRASEHVFYTASRTGQTAAGPIPRQGDLDAIQAWLERYLALTTYEISCPALRDPTLAPAGKTGLVVSVLFDYTLTKRIEELGWYEEFKSFAGSHMVDVLESSIYPGLRDAVLHRFTATPATIAQHAGTTEGAITGWAFANDPMPAEDRLPRILNAVRTPLPDLFQAGQWTYSPSGLPISILTGKLAADQARKGL